MLNKQSSLSSSHAFQNWLLVPIAELHISAVAVERKNHASEVNGIDEA
jgi:hypothetical protein